MTLQVATFIIQKILVQDEGLRYFCSFAERFFALARVMGTMVDNLVEEPSQRLLKHIIHCYVRLSDCPRLVQHLSSPNLNCWGDINIMILNSWF